MKKLLLLTLSLVMILSLASCQAGFDPYDFTQQGLQITLDTSFVMTENSGYTACYRSSVATVYVLREEFGDTLSKDLSLTEYTDQVLKANGMEREVTDSGDHLTFTYEYTINDSVMVNETCLYKMSDAFWIVRFECRSDYYDSLNDSFTTWAASVQDVKIKAD